MRFSPLPRLAPPPLLLRRVRRGKNILFHHPPFGRRGDLSQTRYQLIAMAIYLADSVVSCLFNLQPQRSQEGD
jgi:hypothetical protein